MAQKKAKNMNNLYSGRKNMKFCEKRELFFIFSNFFYVRTQKKTFGISKTLNVLFKKMAS